MIPGALKMLESRTLVGKNVIPAFFLQQKHCLWGRDMQLLRVWGLLLSCIVSWLVSDHVNLDWGVGINTARKTVLVTNTKAHSAQRWVGSMEAISMEASQIWLKPELKKYYKQWTETWMELSDVTKWSNFFHSVCNSNSTKLCKTLIILVPAGSTVDNYYSRNNHFMISYSLAMEEMF